MSSIRGKDTKPEVAVRRMLHSMGYRFRLHRRDLPGTPDIVIPRLRLCVFVHGCFWHQHRSCSRARRPSSNTEFWEKKLKANIARDEAATRDLAALGWQVATIWECETKNASSLEDALKQIFAIFTKEGRIVRPKWTDRDALADFESRKS
jgi:DNA mismatch endonuclease (patch repair protein)